MTDEKGTNVAMRTAAWGASRKRSEDRNPADSTARTQSRFSHRAPCSTAPQAHTMALRLQAVLRLAAHAAGGAPLRNRPALILGARTSGGVRVHQLLRLRQAVCVRQPPSARSLHVCSAADGEVDVALPSSASDSAEAAAVGVDEIATATGASQQTGEKPSPFAAIGVRGWKSSVRKEQCGVCSWLDSLAFAPAAPREDLSQNARPRRGAPDGGAGAPARRPSSQPGWTVAPN